MSDNASKSVSGGSGSKNKSPPTKVSSRYMTSTKSSTSRSERVSKPLSAVEEKTTPEKISGTKKACSTPTNDEVSISDLTLDASCITRVKSATDMDETVKCAPVMKMKSQTAAKPARSQPGATRSVNRTMMAPVRTVGTARKPPLQGSSFKSAMKQVSRDVEALETDPEDVTDEMMETAYFRYLQAKFIAMKSREAKKKAEEDSRNQILQAFFATEQLRMEVQKKSLEVVMADSLTAMKKSLSMVDRKITPVVEALKSATTDLGRTAVSLEGTKHNLVVQGINLGDQEETKREIDNLEKMFLKFNEDLASYYDIAKSNSNYIENISSSFREVTDDYNKLVKLVDSVKKLMKDTESLAVKEASLAISLEEIGNIE